AGPPDPEAGPSTPHGSNINGSNVNGSNINGSNVNGSNINGSNASPGSREPAREGGRLPGVQQPDAASGVKQTAGGGPEAGPFVGPEAGPSLLGTPISGGVDALVVAVFPRAGE
ncbi:hypothetical protein T484DRAFT_1811962, partial [Baffinella frigidus]